MGTIDWKKVNENLYCPICGDKAHIRGETDGTRGTHTHDFAISRQWAEQLSLPSLREVQTRIIELEKELATLRELQERCT